jgi:hypothetical protein
VFLHSVGPADNVVHSDAFRPRKVDALFFMLGWDPYGFDKKRAGTHYAELVFLHPVAYVGCVVQSGASRT